MILAEATRSTCAVAARVSQTWFEVAIVHIWHRVDSTNMAAFFSRLAPIVHQITRILHDDMELDVDQLVSIWAMPHS